VTPLFFYLKLIELNLERFPNLADLFSENNPEEILKNIEAGIIQLSEYDYAVPWDLL